MIKLQYLIGIYFWIGLDSNPFILKTICLQQQQREFSSTHIQEVSKEHKQQLSLQRQEYESTIQRHLSFIDQLIDDKKVLSQRCEDLVKKLKETDQKYSTKLKTLEDKYGVISS